MKKYFALFLSFLIILSFTVTIFADSNENSRSLETEFSHEIYKLADKHSTVIGDLKEFTPFEVNRHKIRIYIPKPDVFFRTLLVYIPFR